ncbi:MAG: winged helix DNA-binding protein [Firmicutes bacterium]|nr:winged helix DNA-binding protein [Bacillota bacterium]
MAVKSNKEKLQDFFISSFYSILSTEEKALEAFSGGELSLKEIHLIAAVFKTKSANKNNFSTVARVLNITLGTLTTSFSRLQRKGYLKKVPHETDKRIFYIEPTDKAEMIHAEHVIFHEKMMAGIVGSLSEEEMGGLMESLTKLDNFFKQLRAEYKSKFAKK